MLDAWKEFVRGKKKRKDVELFGRFLMSHIIGLHTDLAQRKYRHSAYEAFTIADPKQRSIHKAIVRDRLVHHMLYRALYWFFDTIFIADSYSCRIGKGTHRALARFESFARKVSCNNTKTAWVLKCDVRKFFASIDHVVLKSILALYIADREILNLLYGIIDSFYSKEKGKGLPLGNLTSQLLVNIYMNEFDQFVKHRLKAKYYIRYADDFVLMSQDKNLLEEHLFEIKKFLLEKLKLELHPNKVSIETFASGVDFLGWVHFPYHKVPRTTTKNRMYRRIRETGYKEETVQSYLGLLSHGNTYEMRENIKNFETI